MQPVDHSSFSDKMKTAPPAARSEAGGGEFSQFLAAAQINSTGFPEPGNAQERNGLWNMIARERPELLESDVPQGRYSSLEEARAADIRDKLVEAGVDLSTAVIISSREASTRVRRPDGSRPGTGSSGYLNMPESIRSQPLQGNSQVREGTGYAYVDRYGFSHVSKDLAVALDFSGNGNVFEYNGRFGGGYPLDQGNSRAILDLPQVRMYSNAQRAAEIEAGENGSTNQDVKLPGTPAGQVSSLPLTEQYIEQFAQNALFTSGSLMDHWQ